MEDDNADLDWQTEWRKQKKLQQASSAIIGSCQLQASARKRTVLYSSDSRSDRDVGDRLISRRLGGDETLQAKTNNCIQHFRVLPSSE